MAKGNSFLDVAAGLLGSNLSHAFEVNLKEFQNTELFIDEIIVLEQIRTEFEDGDNTLQDLADDIAVRGIINSLTVRQLEGSFILVCGERRLKAAILAKLDKVPVRYKEMTDEEVIYYQYSENIHRLDLKLLTEANVVKKLVTKLGTSIKVAAAIKKPESWVSKRLALVDLPPEASRYINVARTDDAELALTIKQVENDDVAEAKLLVDDLIEYKGKIDSRARAKEVRKRVAAKKDVVIKSQPPLHSDESVPDTRNTDSADVHLVENRLIDAFDMLTSNGGLEADTVVDTLTQDEKERIETRLKSFYIVGGATKNPEQYLVNALRSRTFGLNGHKCFAMVAFLFGYKAREFDLIDIFECVKNNPINK